VQLVDLKRCHLFCVVGSAECQNVWFTRWLVVTHCDWEFEKTNIKNSDAGPFFIATGHRGSPGRLSDGQFVTIKASCTDNTEFGDNTRAPCLDTTGRRCTEKVFIWPVMDCQVVQ
jgi:hypothetical protein